MAASIAAGEQARLVGLPLEVQLLERDDRVGRSILATGNGRCNFSNAHVDVDNYHNAAFVDAVLGAVEEARGADPVHAFFESCGLEWREEADGRQYPAANKASVVVDVLRSAAGLAGAREECGEEVRTVEPPREAGKRFTMRMKDGVFRRADAVIVVCGGRALGSFEAVGIPVRDQLPVLGPIRCAPADAAITRELDNIRVRCAVSLAKRKDAESAAALTERGELMFRKYGVSGICVFNLSRFAEPGDVLHIDFLQLGGVEAAKQYLVARRKRLVQRYGDGLTYEDMLRGLLLPRVSEALLKSAGVKLDVQFGRKDVARLAELLCDFPLEVAGIADPDICQVRRGGFAVDAFDASSLMAVKVPGLFAAGEALDVDGPCGGYNLHWAWASGLLAGQSAVDYLCKQG